MTARLFVLTEPVELRESKNYCGPVGEITAIDEGAVTVRWPYNRTTVHLDCDLKPLESSLE
jgi:hypothetical protein